MTSINFTQPVIEVNVGDPTLTINLSTSEVVINTRSQSLELNFPQSLTGRGVPAGGEELDILIKNGNGDFDTVWISLVGLLAATVEPYDNDDDAIAAGKSYYKASPKHQSAYKGTFIIL